MMRAEANRARHLRAHAGQRSGSSAARGLRFDDLVGDINGLVLCFLEVLDP